MFCTPFFNVTIELGQLLHAPCSFSLTTPSSKPYRYTQLKTISLSMVLQLETVSVADWQLVELNDVHCIVHQMAWRHTIWLQTYDVCPTCLPDDVCDHHWPISSMSASRSVQLLETEPSLSPVLDYGTVCHQTLSCVPLCRGSGENLKHFSFDSLTPLFWFSYFFSWFLTSWSLRFLHRPH